MKKTILSVFIFILAANSWSALATTPWEVAFGFSRYHERIDNNNDASVGLFTGQLGYTFEVADRISVTPYLELGVGMSEDTLLGIELSINNVATLGAKLQSQINDTFAVFVSPTFTHVTAEASYQGYSEVAKDSELGYALGVNVNTSPTTNLELSYQSINKVDANIIALKFNFKL